MDLLAELAFASLPPSPPAGRSAPHSTAPTDLAPGDFAAEMQEASEARPLDSAKIKPPSDDREIAGAQHRVLDPVGILSEHHTESPETEPEEAARRPDGSPAVLALDPGVLPSSLPTIPTEGPDAAASDRHQGSTPDEEPSRPSLLESAAVTESEALPVEPAPAGADEAALRAAADGQTREARDALPGQIEAEPDRQHSEKTPDPLSRISPGDDPIARVNESGSSSASSPEPQARAPASQSGARHEAPPPELLAASARPAAGDRRNGHAHGEPAPAAGVSASLSAPASRPRAVPSDAAGSLPGVEAKGSAGGPDRTRAPQAAEVEGEPPPLERSAAQERPFGAAGIKPDEFGSKPPPSDGQAGRAPQIPNPQGNGPSVTHATVGVSFEPALAMARGFEGVVIVEGGPAPAAQQVALQITKTLEHDRTDIRIRLDPPELGDVDIHFEFRDLRLTATISAERPDTLDLLQRDARTLIRALREAGIEFADSDLSFADNGRSGHPDAGPFAQRTVAMPHPVHAPAPREELFPALSTSDGFVSLQDGRMDLRA